MKVTLTLDKSLIMETVKNETHISAHIIRASNKEASEVAFQQEAGDEAYHERKLERSLYASTDKVIAMIAGLLDSEGGAVSKNISATAFTISITVSDRFDDSLLTPLADLVSKYIEDNMLFLWWTPLDGGRAKGYAEHVELDRISIIQCFVKKAPTAAAKGYDSVTGTKDTTTNS